jgi:hypothetical protein
VEQGNEVDGPRDEDDDEREGTVTDRNGFVVFAKAAS